MYELELIMLVLLTFLVYFVYKKCRRISSLSDLPSDISGLWLTGIVVSVDDGDGFKFFHVPWLRSSQYTPEDSYLSIRLAGIDAPETDQPFFIRAKKTLKDLVLDKTVKLKLLKVDQYYRILATCYLDNSTTNVNKKMVAVGMACVYKGKDAIYDDYEDELVRLEAKAKERKIGIWSRNDYVSPMDHKRKLRDIN